MTNELSVVFKTVGAAVDHMQQQPASILLMAVLCVVGMMLKHLSPFPNRFIPAVVIAIGAFANAFLGDVGSVDPAQRHPVAVLAMQGFLLGFGAWAVHRLVIQRFEKFLPFDDDKKESR
jgi:hypothetical protein